MQIVNLDKGYYLRHTSEKALATVEKEKKDKYLHTCMECQRYFNPMVYSANGIPEKEAVAAQQRLALLLSNNLKREYLEMCGFVRAQMSLAILIPKSLILRGARDTDEYIQQRLNLEDGTVMALMAPWQD